MPRSTRILIAGLMVAEAAWAADSEALKLDQLGAPRANTPAGAAQVPQQAAPAARAGAIRIEPAAPPPARTSSANVPQAQAQVDLCERILLGQAPPVAGLDCTRSQLETPTRESGALAPRTLPGEASGLDRTIDSIGRDPSATTPDGGVPPIIILGPR